MKGEEETSGEEGMGVDEWEAANAGAETQQGWKGRDGDQWRRQQGHSIDTAIDRKNFPLAHIFPFRDTHDGPARMPIGP